MKKIIKPLIISGAVITSVAASTAIIISENNKEKNKLTKLDLSNFSFFNVNPLRGTLENVRELLRINISSFNPTIRKNHIFNEESNIDESNSIIAQNFKGKFMFSQDIVDLLYSDKVDNKNINDFIIEILNMDCFMTFGKDVEFEGNTPQEFSNYIKNLNEKYIEELSNYSIYTPDELKISSNNFYIFANNNLINLNDSNLESFVGNINDLKKELNGYKSELHFKIPPEMIKIYEYDDVVNDTKALTGADEIIDTQYSESNILKNITTFFSDEAFKESRRLQLTFEGIANPLLINLPYRANNNSVFNERWSLWSRNNPGSYIDYLRMFGIGLVNGEKLGDVKPSLYNEPNSQNSHKNYLDKWFTEKMRYLWSQRHEQNDHEVIVEGKLNINKIWNADIMAFNENNPTRNWDVFQAHEPLEETIFLDKLHNTQTNNYGVVPNYNNLSSHYGADNWWLGEDKNFSWASMMPYMSRMISWSNTGDNDISIPFGDVTDMLHKNGVKSLGSLFVFRNKQLFNFLRKNVENKYTWVENIIKICKKYKFDGYFINWEPLDVGSLALRIEIVKFITELRKRFIEEDLWLEFYSNKPGGTLQAWDSDIIGYYEPYFGLNSIQYLSFDHDSQGRPLPTDFTNQSNSIYWSSTYLNKWNDKYHSIEESNKAQESGRLFSPQEMESIWRLHNENKNFGVSLQTDSTRSYLEWDDPLTLDIDEGSLPWWLLRLIYQEQQYINGEHNVSDLEYWSDLYLYNAFDRQYSLSSEVGTWFHPQTTVNQKYENSENSWPIEQLLSDWSTGRNTDPRSEGTSTLSEFYQERTTLNSSKSFFSSFNTAYQRDNFFIRGEQLKSEFINHNISSIPPTYQWVIDKYDENNNLINWDNDNYKENTINANYNHENAWYGTTSINFSGELKSQESFNNKLYGAKINANDIKDFTMYYQSDEDLNLIVWDDNNSQTIINNTSVQDADNDWKKATYQLPSSITNIKYFGLNYKNTTTNNKSIDLVLGGIGYNIKNELNDINGAKIDFSNIDSTQYKTFNSHTINFELNNEYNTKLEYLIYRADINWEKEYLMRVNKTGNLKDWNILKRNINYSELSNADYCNYIIELRDEEGNILDNKKMSIIIDDTVEKI